MLLRSAITEALLLLVQGAGVPLPAEPRAHCAPARRRRGRRAKAPAALGGGLAVTVEPLRELTAAQLRQLDGEVGLVGTVMEETATLTVGPETAQLCCR
jgi:hypothetical protein